MQVLGIKKILNILISKKKNVVLITIFFTFFLDPFYFVSQNKNYENIIQKFSDKAWEAITEEKDSGIYYSNKIIRFSKENKDTYNEMLGYEYRGIYNEAVLNEYDKAITDYLQAIAIAEKYHKDFVSDMHIEIGILFQKIGDALKALTYLEKAVELSEKNSVTHCFSALSLATTQTKLKKYNEAHKNFIFFIKHDSLTKQDKEEAYLGLAKNFSQQKIFDKAQENFIKSIEADSLKGKLRYAPHYVEIIDNAVLMKNTDTIHKYLKLLHKSFSTVSASREKLRYFQSVANSYKILKNFNKVSDYLDSIIVTKDMLANKRYNRNLSELETQYQTKKKEEQILEEQSKKQLWSSISIIAFIILVVVVSLLYKNNQKRKQLKANKIELESLLNQRNMLLRETHHRVKNSFQMVSSLLQLQAQGSEATAAVKALDSAVERVNSMIVLHQQLYAKDNLLGVNLQTYIKDLITEINTSYANENIAFNTNISSVVVDIDTATSLGLLVNELATNSIKYAWKNKEADKVITINLDENEGKISFMMFDNGKGKKTKTTKQNYGSELIEILIERLEATQKPLTENDFGLHITFKKQNG